MAASLAYLMLDGFTPTTEADAQAAEQYIYNLKNLETLFE